MNIKKLLFVPMLLIAIIATAQKANLTLQPTPGKKYAMTFTSSVDMTQNISGMDMKVKATSVGEATMEIEQVEANGNIVTLISWNKIEGSSSAMGQDTTLLFDNLNLQTRTIYDSRGKVVSSEQINTEKAASPELAMIQQMVSNMKLPILAGKEVSQGETWLSHTTDTVEAAGSPFPMLTSTEETYTYAGVESKDNKEYQRINVVGPIEISGEGMQMGMNMSIEGSGMQEGYSLHDKNSLFPMFISIKVGFDMSIIISGGQNMAIPMTQNMVSETVFTEI